MTTTIPEVVEPASPRSDDSLTKNENVNSESSAGVKNEADEKISAPVQKPATKAAAVGFDTTDQKLRVITADAISETTEKGDTIDVDGRMLTILEFCDSIESARVSCEEHASEMNGMGLSSIKFEQNEGLDNEDGNETSTSDGDKDMYDDGGIEDVIVGDEIDIDAVLKTSGSLQEFSAMAALQQQIDDMRTAMRDAVALTMSDLQHDVNRVQEKQARLVTFFQKFLGTEADGRVRNPFSDKCPTKVFDPQGGTSFLPSGRTVDDVVATQFEQMEKLWNTRTNQTQRFTRNEIITSSHLMGTKAKPKTPSQRRAEDSGEQEYTFGTNGTQGKRIVNGIVKEVDKLYYPFISREEEEECLEAANGQAPIYAQMLAKILFSETIMMYFKDQDTAKRNWLHDAVDYRFPTLDKPTHVSKWKNCSFFINKNMREAVIASGNPMPRAPCGPRGPIGPKDKSKTEKNDVCSIDGDEDDMPSTPAPSAPKSKGMRVNREASLEGIEWDYLDADYEKECYEECRGDQYKYAELMALRLFKDSLTIKFKEQDQTKKEWLRECVEARFPVEDRERNDQRWKICGQTCNRNRTKIVGADGREEKYPYFSQSVEEECFKKCDKQVAVYAELMNAKLFPDTQYMFFKDQDLGKRNWLHTILDKRFPSTDKITQTSKWKQCTNAINKKLFDGTVTPITREAMMNSSQLNDTDSSMVEPETPASRSSVARFERRVTSEAPATTSSLKRRAVDNDSEPPAVKRESIRNKQKKEKEIYTAYPYVSEEDEVAIFESSNGNPQVYGRELGRVLFADTIKHYFKDQDPDKRQWIHEILDFRFPSKNPLESKQKWKNVTAAINRNMTTAVVSRRSLPR